MERRERGVLVDASLTTRTPITQRLPLGLSVQGLCGTRFGYGAARQSETVLVFWKERPWSSIRESAMAVHFNGRAPSNSLFRDFRALPGHAIATSTVATCRILHSRHMITPLPLVSSTQQRTSRDRPTFLLPWILMVILSSRPG